MTCNDEQTKDLNGNNRGKMVNVAIDEQSKNGYKWGIFGLSM